MELVDAPLTGASTPAGATMKNETNPIRPGARNQKPPPPHTGRERRTKTPNDAQLCLQITERTQKWGHFW
jgi:hypothetical protein